MAKAKKKKKPKIYHTRTVYRTVAFNIHVKGPKRNKSFELILDKLKGRLTTGKSLKVPTLSDKILFSCDGFTNPDNSLQLTIVKKDSSSVNSLWDDDTDSEADVGSKSHFSKSTLIVYPHEHIALLILSADCPTHQELSHYLKSILQIGAKELEMEVYIEINAIRVPSVKIALSQMSKVKYLEVERFRLNPTGSEPANEIARIFQKTNADSAKIELTALSEDGLDRKGIDPLIEEADKNIKEGYGSMRAVGTVDGKELTVNSRKMAIDIKKVKIDKEDPRELSTLLHEQLVKPIASE